MNEALLHFIWRTLRFRTTGLFTTDGREVELIEAGKLNSNQGPDFIGTRLRIDGVEWLGNVELDMGTEHWVIHGHNIDPRHNATILHVVYHSSGKALSRADGSGLPELALESAIDPELIARYRMLMEAELPFPCANRIAEVPSARIRSYLQSLGWQRLTRKAEELFYPSPQANTAWDQLAWQQLAAAFGTSVNKEAFQMLASAVPYKALRLQRDQPLQLEALLLGGAGFLNAEAQDEYTSTLQREWKHLARKFGLQPVPEGTFNFGRMRPMNFPTVRIAQIAALLTHYDLVELVEEPFKLLEVANPKAKAISPSDYWLAHYRLGVLAKEKPKPVTREMLDLLLINALIPVSIEYYRQLGRDERIEALSDGLLELPAEKNHITELYKPYGIRPLDALEGQGLLELYKTYCTPRSCLACTIGYQLIRGKV
jgi:hypothetical protein